MGEEKPKGFLINITIDLKDIIENNDINKCILKINDYKVNNNIYKLRLKIKLINNKEFLDKVTMLQDYYLGNKFITIDIDNSNILLPEEDSNKFDEYDYLFDNTEPERKLSKFIDKNFNYKLTPDRINELLTSDILKLIDKYMEETE